MFRTDLAVEAQQKNAAFLVDGVSSHEETVGTSKIMRMNIKNEDASRRIGKPVGTYVTVEVPALTDHFEAVDERIQIISKELLPLLPDTGLVLVVGLGNQNITPDAFGPKTVASVLATRHLSKELARATGLQHLRPVAVLSPGVLGQTGIDVCELLLSVVKSLHPCAVIAIDALASMELRRLGCTVQIANTGISPGSGVGNCRPRIDAHTLGVPVISMGVPTVVDAATLAFDLLGLSKSDHDSDVKQKIEPRGEAMIVTPREIDLLIERASKLTAMSINCALHPTYHPKDLMSLIS